MLTQCNKISSWISKGMSITVFSLLANACTMVGPDFKKPIPTVANHWLGNSAAIKSAQIKNTDWWDTFHDPTLTALIHQGYQNNLTLQIAGVHVLEARAQLAQSVGELYPQKQGVTGNYTKQRISGSSLDNLLPQNFDTAMFGLSSTWEIDFWGKYRRAIQSNKATLQASLAAYDNALVTLTADIGSTYINIRTLQTKMRVTQKNIQLQTESLKIAQSRFNAGETSLLDVTQAQTELSSTEAKLPTLVANLQRQKDILAVLLGTTPDKVDSQLKGPSKIPETPLTVAVGIPRDALKQRPDVSKALFDAMAQSAAIGAVKANLYPAFSLSGTFAFASNNIGNASLSDIFNWSNHSYSFGPSVAWPLFNYGQITNAVRMQDAAFQATLLNYLNVVLKAQQEVQDNITNYIQVQKVVQSLTTANDAATKSTQLVLIRYKEGESDYNTVLDVERQQLNVQTSLTGAQGDTALAVVALYRSLGGGWQIRQGHDIVSESIKSQMAKRTNWGNLLAQPMDIRNLYWPSW